VRVERNPSYGRPLEISSGRWGKGRACAPPNWRAWGPARSHRGSRATPPLISAPLVAPDDRDNLVRRRGASLMRTWERARVAAPAVPGHAERRPFGKTTRRSFRGGEDNPPSGPAADARSPEIRAMNEVVSGSAWRFARGGCLRTRRTPKCGPKKHEGRTGQSEATQSHYGIPALITLEPRRQVIGRIV
jgi:hypothetical protein